MKTPLFFSLTCLTVWLIGCGGDENPIVESPTQNTDSIRCAQKWQKFQLPNDTILTLRYQQPVKLINGSDTMRITVTRIDDFCTVESEKYTYGCQARLWLQLMVNGQCVYQTKHGLTIARRNANPVFKNFEYLGCKSYSTNLIEDLPAGGTFNYYNMVLWLNQITPFAKDDQEFIDLSKNKQKYTITLWLKKRCF